MPPGELRGHDEPEPQGVQLPDAVPDLPHDLGLASRELRPPGDAVPADRRPPARRLRPVPRGRPLHRDPDGLLLLPPGELRGDDEPEPPGLRVPDAVPDLPHHQRLAAGDVRSQQDALPAHRGPPARRLCPLPRGRPLHGDADGLQLLPPGELRGDDEPQPPERRVPGHVPGLPHHDAPGGPRASTTTGATSRSTRASTAASGRAAASATSAPATTRPSSASSATSTRTRPRWTAITRGRGATCTPAPPATSATGTGAPTPPAASAACLEEGVMGILRHVVLPLALALAAAAREPGREEVRRHVSGPVDCLHRRRSRPGREDGRPAPRGGGRENDRRAGGGVGRRAVGVLPDDLADTPDRDRRRRRPLVAGIPPGRGGRARRAAGAGSRRGGVTDTDADADTAPHRFRHRRRRRPPAPTPTPPTPVRRRHRAAPTVRTPAPSPSAGSRAGARRFARRDDRRVGARPTPCLRGPGFPSRACGRGERVILQGQVPLGRERLPRRGPGARPPRGRPARGRGRHGRRRAGGRLRGRAVGLVQAALGEAPGAPGRRRPADLARPGPAGAAVRDDGRCGTGRSLDDEPHRRPRPSPLPTPSPPAPGPACAAAPPSATTRPGTRRSRTTTSRSARGGWTSGSTTSPASR